MHCGTCACKMAAFILFQPTSDDDRDCETGSGACPCCGCGGAGGRGCVSDYGAGGRHARDCGCADGARSRYVHACHQCPCPPPGRPPWPPPQRGARTGADPRLQAPLEARAEHQARLRPWARPQATGCLASCAPPPWPAKLGSAAGRVVNYRYCSDPRPRCSGRSDRSAGPAVSAAKTRMLEGIAGQASSTFYNRHIRGF